LKAFEERVNSHLVGKWVNIASRTAGFVQKFFDGRLAETLPDAESARYSAAVKKLTACVAHFQARDYAAATRLIVEVADEANGYVAEQAPWRLAKDESKRAELHVVCSLALNYFRLLATYLAPIVPKMSKLVCENFLGVSARSFRAADALLLGHEIRPFATRIDRIDPKKIEAMVEASKESLKPTDAPQAGTSLASAAAAATATTYARASGKSSTPVTAEAAPAKSDATSGGGTISIEDFAKLDLRIGKVLACEFVDGSDKLLRFELDAGELGKRQIFSGIRSAYGEPARLVGRTVVFIANLAPRKMRFGVSEGMILSAGSGGEELFLLGVDVGGQAGMPVK